MFCSFLFAEDLEERKEVGSVFERGHGVAIYGLVTGELPANDQMMSEWDSKNRKKAHSKSIPSRWYFETVFMIARAKAVRFSLVATAEWKYCEPGPQPPMARIALTCWHIVSHGGQRVRRKNVHVAWRPGQIRGAIVGPLAKGRQCCLVLSF
jgi:hypothetical protein